MGAVLRLVSPSLCVCVWLSLLPACTSKIVVASQAYEQRAQLGLAYAYAQKAALSDPSPEQKNEEQRLFAAQRAFLLAERDAADAQKNEFMGLASHLRLLAHLATQKNEGEERASLEKRRVSLAKRSEQILDQRLSRQEVLLADYAACMRTAALSEQPATMARCGELRSGLKRWVDIRVEGDVPQVVLATQSALRRALQDGSNELIASVEPNDARANYELVVWVHGRGSTVTEPFAEEERRVVRGMVKTGKKEKVTVPPSKDELDKAKREKKPAPEPTVEEKPLYRAARGEYRIYRALTEHRRPYLFAFRRLRDARTAAAKQAVAVSKDERRYFDYDGDETLRDDPKGLGEGVERAGRAKTNNELEADATDRMLADIVKQVIAQTEEGT